MNIKKTAVTLAAAGAMLASAMPAFAFYMPSNVDVTKVDAYNSAESNTGKNDVELTAVKGGRVRTGKVTLTTGSSVAVAEQYVVTDVNLGCNNCNRSRGPQPLTKDVTKVKAYNSAESNTGKNDVELTAVKGGRVNTTGGEVRLTTGWSEAGTTQWVVSDVNVYPQMHHSPCMGHGCLD